MLSFRTARLLFVLLAAAFAGCGVLSAQTARSGVVLVLPFENRSGNASLNWVGDSFPDTLDARLNSAGFLTVSQDDRRFALDHLGLPTDFRPSRATTIRIAQQLDAHFVVIGSFTTQPGFGGAAAPDRLNIQAQVLDVSALKLSPALQDSAELTRLFDGENAIAWKVARTIDPKFSVSEPTFLAASGAVSLPAFENYIRGTNAPTQQERLKRLQDAVKATPGYAAALLALGKEQYAAHDFTAAAATLAKVPPASTQALEASFFLGLARFNSNNYAGAEQAFDFVSTRLPLPEVLNNLGVAQSRQNKNSVDTFKRASQADPNDADYHYNLAVSLFRQGDTAAALREADAALKLRPSEQDFGQLRSRLAVVTPGTHLRDIAQTSFQPVERIRRTYSEASYRQAEFQLNQLREARLSTLPPAQRAAEYTSQGRDALNRGELLQAEQAFQGALAADGNSADAHLGMAEVRSRSGASADARAEAQQSIRLRPSAQALLLLAQMDMAGNNLAAAADDVSKALRLEPANAAAVALKLSLQQRGQQVR